MDWIKEILKGLGLTDEQITTAMSKFNAEFPKNAVPKSVYNDKAQEVVTAKADLATAQADLAAAKKEAGNALTYKQQLDQTTTDFTNYKAGIESEKATAKVKDAVVAALTDRKALPDALDLLVGSIDLKSVKLGDDGKIVEPDKLFGPLQEKRKALFGQTSTEGAPPAPGGGGGGGETDLGKLSMDDYFKARNPGAPGGNPPAK